jgi:hypothetical protein
MEFVHEKAALSETSSRCSEDGVPYSVILLDDGQGPVYGRSPIQRWTVGRWTGSYTVPGMPIVNVIPLLYRDSGGLRVDRISGRKT